MRRYPEEVGGGSFSFDAILDARLSSEVLDRLDRRLHLLECQEGGQIGCVRRDHDHGEEPPGAARDAPRH